MTQQTTTEALAEDVSQAPSPLRVTVYAKPSGCQPCKATMRKLDQEKIPFNKILVHEEEKTLIDELKHEATLLGVTGELPCVVVYDTTTEDTHTWFGYQPTEIMKLKERLQP